jgi:DNA mismatch repair protein MutS
MTLIEDYMKLQKQYEAKYGEKTIVLYECGQFFEIYGVVNETENFGKIYEISDLTNLSVSKRSDKYAPVSRKNPLMAGFPNHSFEKWKDILLKHNYTVIKIEQDGHGTKDPERSVTEIISPGINIDCTSFSNNLMSIYIDDVRQKSTNKLITYAGVSTIDITTGENNVYEIRSKLNDNSYTLEELFRVIQTYNPAEIIINTESISISKEELIKYLEIENRNVHFNNYEDSKYLLDNKYKLPFLNKLFPNHNMLNAIEYIDLERNFWALSSYVYLLQFAYEHNESIIKKLIKPKILETNNYLTLSYDSINQLNVIPNKNLQVNSKIDSLWNLVDKTSTCLGRRFLKDNLLNPIISIEELEKRYNLVETFIKEDNEIKLYIHFEKYLNKILILRDFIEE